LHKFIIDYIKAQQNSVTEYQLLKVVEQAYPEFFRHNQKSLSLYKKHFKLFNMLYQIDQQLAQTGSRLSLSPLKIELLDVALGKCELSEPDKLREFYLDSDNLLLSELEIDKMLLEFWSKYHARLDVSDDLELMGIDQQADITRTLIKRKYTQLAFKLHPDQGGEATQFRKLQTAYQRLKQLYK
jgi:hypothetical protein